MLPEADDLSVWNVSNVRLAVKGDKVMLAQAVQPNVPHDHHLVILLGKDRSVQDVVYVLLVAFDVGKYKNAGLLINTFREKIHRFSRSGRSFQQSFSFWILPDVSEDALVSSY